jgi:hypothetical protein
MIDVNNETLVTLNQARAHAVFLTDGKRCSLGKIYRLAQHGARAVNGDRIRLEVIKTPTGLLTSREAIQRFVQLLSDPEADLPAPAPRARRKQIQHAEDELTAAGFEIGGPATA